MSTSIYWLKKQLKNSAKFKVIDKNIGEIDFKGEVLRVYCPTTSEYEITVDILLKASKNGVRIVTYPTSWCEATREAIAHGKTMGIDVMPFGKFLGVYGE